MMKSTKIVVIPHIFYCFEIRLESGKKRMKTIFELPQITKLDVNGTHVKINH